MIRRAKPEAERDVSSVRAAASSRREKSLKGFLFAKLYFGIKQYELAERYISSYLSVRERDPRAHRLLGQIYEAQDNIEEAVGCYKRSVELNPTQKDLVLKIAELLCHKDITDGRAKFWIEKASRLFPGNLTAYRLKERLLESEGEDGRDQLLDVIRTELCARPDDTDLNIRLVAVYRSSNRLRDAVLHCQEAEKTRAVESSLEWCSCVIKTFEEYLESVQDVESDQNNWRAVKKDHLLACCSFVKLTLVSGDVGECREALESFDGALSSVKPYVNGADELSCAFLEMKGHLYMHAGTFLLKMAQNNEMQWRDACELAALCYLKSFYIPKPKSVKGDPTGQDMLEMLACDRKSQSGHMLLNLSRGKEDFLQGIVECFANQGGLFTLFESLFGSGASRERSFIATDDLGSVSTQAPVQGELSEYDTGAVRMHSRSLLHLVWLGLQWNSMSALLPLRKLLKQLFHLPQETSRIESDAPESICLLDLEVFLLGTIFTSSLQLQEKFNALCEAHRPPFLPLLLCEQYCSEKQRSWWDAVCTLLWKKTTLESAAKLRLLVQHGLSTLRALEKHGLQPALIIHWARNLQKTGVSLTSVCDRKEYIERSVYYWKKILLSLETVKKNRSVPEPIDPLFRHFRNVDIEVFQVAAYEEEACTAFAALDVVEGKTDAALLALEDIKNVVSYGNLAILSQRKAEEMVGDDMLPAGQEERKACLLKRKRYLLKIIDESSSDPSVADKLPVSVETVREMMNTVILELGENDEEESLASRNLSQAAVLQVRNPVLFPGKLPSSPFSASRKFCPQALHEWAEECKSLVQMLCQQMEALKNEMREMKLNSCNGSVSSRWWPAESCGTDTVSDGCQRAQHLPAAPLAVASTAPSVDRSQSPACNAQCLRKTAATDVTPAKASLCGKNGLAPQLHISAYQEPIHTPPPQSTSAGVFPQDTHGPPLYFNASAAGIVPPRGDDWNGNRSIPQARTNPLLLGPDYFTKPLVVPTALKPEESKVVEFSKTKCKQLGTVEGSKPPQPTAFQFSTDSKNKDGGFTFSSPLVATPPANGAFNSSERLLKLLTSDQPLQAERCIEPRVNSHANGQRNTFSFSNKHTSGICFTESVGQNADKNVAFEKIDPFNVQEPSKPPFFMTSNSDLAYRSHEAEGGSAHGGGEDDDGPHFDLVVPLPDKVEVKTGEEDKEEYFCSRAMLFQLYAKSEEQKERGVGNVKIRKSKVSGKLRPLRRRDQRSSLNLERLSTPKTAENDLGTASLKCQWNCCAPAFMFQNAADAEAEAKAAKEGLSFSMLMPPGGFKLGTQGSNQNGTKKDDPPRECTTVLKTIDEKDQNEVPPSSGIMLQSQEAAEKDRGEFSFGQNSASNFTFADLAKSTPGEGFWIGKKDPNFEGFSGAGEQLFSLKVSQADHKASTSADLGKKDADVSEAEDSDYICFEPIVQVPEKVEPFTGEEAEKVLYSQRVKLFRFDPDRSQWKERGVGSLKILKNGANVKVVLMQREQVLKVCANHWRTTKVNLKELSGSGKAWMWMASDSSDGNANLGQLAAKFRTPKQAEEFKQKFEECQQLLLDVPVRTPPKLDTGRTAQLTQKAEETKCGFKDLETSVTDARTKPAEEETRNSVCASGTSDSVIKMHGEGTAPALERSDRELREEASLRGCVYALPLASSPVRKSLSRIGESAAGSLQSASSPSSSPANQSQSGASLKSVGCCKLI